MRPRCVISQPRCLLWPGGLGEKNIAVCCCWPQVHHQICQHSQGAVRQGHTHPPLPACVGAWVRGCVSCVSEGWLPRAYTHFVRACSSRCTGTGRFDWAIIVDTDTYLVMENLRQYLVELKKTGAGVLPGDNVTNGLYVGAPWPPNKVRAFPARRFFPCLFAAQSCSEGGYLVHEHPIDTATHVFMCTYSVRSQRTKTGTFPQDLSTAYNQGHAYAIDRRGIARAAHAISSSTCR